VYKVDDKADNFYIVIKGTVETSEEKMDEDIIEYYLSQQKGFRSEHEHNFWKENTLKRTKKNLFASKQVFGVNSNYSKQYVDN